MAQNQGGVIARRAPVTIAERLKIAELRIRPMDGGFTSYDSPWALSPNKSPNQRAEYSQNYILRPRGGVPFLTSPGMETITYMNVFEFNDTTQSVGYMFTLTKAYYFSETSPAVYTLFGPIPGPAFNSIPYERWSTVQLDLKVYAVSFNNALVYGDGAGYAFVPGAFPARFMFMLNGHMVLGGLNDTVSGPDLQEVLISQIFTTHPVTFAGPGSQRTALSDTNGILMNGMPLSPLNAFLYKSDSIIEMRATGDVTIPFEFIERSRSIGIMFPFSLVQWKGAQFFCGSDYQIYLYDGSQFKEIGNDVRNEIFEISQPLGANIEVDRAIAMFDYTTREYMIAIGTQSTAMRVFAYNVDRKRWRVCEYENLTYWVTKHLRRPVAYGHAQYTRYFPFCCTLTGRLLYLEKTPNFDIQVPVPFVYETPDFVAQKDGEEGTLLQVIVAISNNAVMDLTMDISHDSGVTFGTAITRSSRPSPPFEAEQALVFDTFDTGLKFRIRLRNSIGNQAVLVESITLRISSVGDWRREGVS